MTGSCLQALFISSNFAAGHVSIGATTTSLRPAGTDTGASVNHVALLLGQDGLADVVDRVVVSVTASTSASGLCCARRPGAGTATSASSRPAPGARYKGFDITLDHL